MKGMVVGILLFILNGCINNSNVKKEDEACEPIIISIEETERLIINGFMGIMEGEYWSDLLLNVWVNTENPKEYLIIITEKDFVWLRVDEDDYGYLYGGEYESDEETIHLIVYGKGEVIEEYRYEYLIEEGWQHRLYLKDENGVVAEYLEMPNWPEMPPLDSEEE